MSDTPDLGRRELVRRETDELARVSSALVTRGLRDIGRIEQPKEFTNSIGMRFVLIPAGTFRMGSSPADVAAALKADSTLEEEHLKDEQPQHTVRISQPFYMGLHEVTQNEYEQVTGTNPSWFSKTGGGSDNVSGQDTGKFPVEMVSWFDAVEFCNTLSSTFAVFRVLRIDLRK